MTLEQYRAMLHGIEGYLDAYASEELDEVRRFTLAVVTVMEEHGVEEPLRDSLVLMLSEAIDAKFAQAFTRGWNSALSSIA